MKWIWLTLLVLACGVAPHPSDGGAGGGANDAGGGGGNDAGGSGGGGSSDGGSSDAGSCGGFGGGNEAWVQPNPTSYDFGDVVVGQAVTAEIDLYSGLGSSDRLVGPDAAAFTLTWQCVPRMFPPFLCLGQLTFRPVHDGPSTANIELKGSSGEGLCMPLAGNGVASSGLRLTPSMNTLDALVGGSSNGALTLTNDGTVPTGTLGFAWAGDDAPIFSIDSSGCPTVLDAGESCTIPVEFGPGVQQQRYLASVKVSAQPSGSAVAELIGTGFAPGTLGFDGGVTLGYSGASPTRAGVVQNFGEFPVGTLSAPVITGPNASSFSIVSEQCSGVTLDAGESCSLTVTLLSDAADGGLGTREATLSISSSDGLDASVRLAGSAY